MRIAVMGAGAVGCWFGGLLAAAGHDVVLVARAAHVEAIRAQGLRMTSATMDRHVPIGADTHPDGVAGASLVLCCVKSADTESAADAMAPHLAPGAMVWSLQNGVDNADRLRARLQPVRPDVVVEPAVVYVATGMAGPGHVRHHGRGELVIRPSALRPGIAEAFASAGVQLPLSDRVTEALWDKLIVNCAYNALSAIAQRPYGELWAQPMVVGLIRDVVNEAAAVAAAEGLQLADPWPAVVRIAETMPGQRSSTAMDLARGRPTEVDHLNGYVVRRGEALGVPTPANRALQVTLHLLEGRPPA